MKSITRYFAIAAILSMAIFGTAFGQPPETEPPTVPTGLSVIEIHNEALGITWNASTDNTGVAGYSIYVNSVHHGNSNDNEYIILSLSPGTTYNITVSAVDVYNNESAQSPSISEQTTIGGITGRVLSGGSPVSGAYVVLSGQGLEIDTQTEPDGSYSFVPLWVGGYTISTGSLSYGVEVYDNHTTVQDFRAGEGLPVVSTSDVSSVTSNGAICGGYVNEAGILDKGVIWSTTPNITVLTSDTVSNGPVGDGIYVSDLSAYLSPNTVYYIRAWARNAVGIGFGQEFRFYTGCIPMILNESITHVSSCAGSDGSISISHLELDPAYTYSYNWTGPNAYVAFSSEIDNLETGWYEITVTDQNGCETVKSYEVMDPGTPEINNLSQTICNDGSFSITPVNVTDGIVPPGTTYSWGVPVVTGGLTGGIAASGQTNISGTLNNPTNTAQTATYTVTPVSGTCTGADFTVTVTVVPTPLINNLSVSACEGIEFNITPVNGTDGIVPPGTTYSWGSPVVTGGLTGGVAAAGQASIHGTLLNPTTIAQTATYTVTPVSGTCTGATFTVTVTIHPIPAITGESLTHLSCYDCTDGAIAINASGGSPPYVYAWTGPEGFSSTDEDITVLAQGLYTATLMDQNMCAASEQFEVGFPLTVTKTSDYNPMIDGPVIGTLRYAMEYADDNPGLDSICFDIPGDGPFSLYPTSYLPWSHEALIIDGYSQSGASPASETSAATLMIELNGGLMSEEDLAFRNGLVITGEGSTVRGLVINGFDRTGIIVEGTGNVIAGNYIGTNINGTSPIPNDNYGILILGGSDNLVGGTDPASRNILSGNGIHGISIVNPHEGDDAVSHRVEGNYIGLASDGTNAIPNQSSGIYITGSENIIGGEVQGAGNVISGNMENGIFINYREAIGNQILGNIIGLDHTGSAHILNGEGNAESGIFLSNCLETIVGGTTSNTRNIISGNQRGVYVFGNDSHPPSRHRIIGNFIGTDIEGKSSLGNRAEGVYINQEHHNKVGGSATGEGNLISGNGMSGIAIYVSQEDNIQGNYIGTDVSGTKGIPNNHAGINLEACWGIYVGGPEPGEGNLISANNGDGIVIRESETGSSSGIYVKGNYIGTDISGTNPLGNNYNDSEPFYRGNGVSVHGNVSYSWIGGTEANEGNLIAFNDSCGVEINNELLFGPPSTDHGNGIRILSNSIHSNGELGINLYDAVDDTVTVNDPLDADDGPNGFQNYPRLDTVTFTQDEVMIYGSLYSVPGQDFLLQFFVSPKANETGYGEGKTFIGSETVTTDNSGYTNFHLTYPTSLRDGMLLTATATDTTGNTSEFSNAVGGAQDQQASDFNMPMHWVIHEEGIPYITDSSDFLALHRAFDSWESISTSEVDFEYDGPTTQATAVANDGINLITFMDESYFTTKEVLGLAAKTLMMDDASGTAEIVDADIVFNPYYVQGGDGFSTDTHTGLYDLQSIATHEIGHTFGMIHSGVLESTMFFSVLENSTDKRSPEEDDIAWASYRYPKNPEFGTTYGFIKGNITYGDDPLLPAVGGALVIARNTSTGDEIHSYSDEYGNYVIPVPAGTYTVAIEPLDGNVHGYYLTQANISYYIDGITLYTDFPNEFYNGPGEGHLNDNPDEFVPVTVIVADTTHNIDLITNKDVTPPWVMAVTPKRDSVGVSVMTQVFMGFSEQVDINTFTDETCFLTWDDGGSAVEVFGNFVIADNYGRRIGFTPKEYPLEYSTEYTLHMTSGITDLKGNGLTVPVDPYRFTTEDADLTPPRVTDMLPDHGNDTVFTNADIMVFFSEAMDDATTTDGFSITYNGGQVVQGMYSWSQDLRILTFNPDSFLDEGTEYTVSVTSGLKDLSQNPLAKDSILRFSTVPEAQPRILYVGPEPDQDSVSLDSPLLIDFSEPIDLQTINANTVQLLLNNTPVTGTFEFVYSNSRVLFRPDQLLQPETYYDVVVTDQISDVSTPPLLLEEGVSHQFVTADAVQDPYISSLDPSSGVPGTMVTIAGRGIDPNPDNVKVMFGNTEASIIYIESTFLTTRVPAGATEGMVTIEVNGTLSNEEYFYVPPFNEMPGDEIRRTVGTQAQAEDVEIEPDAAYAYITNSGANSITRLNMVTFQVQSLAVGQMPVQIDIHPNGDMAYVSNHLSHDVSVIDLDLMQVVETIAVGINPYGLVVSPTGDLLYVANTTSQDVIYIDVDPYSGGYDKVVRSVRTNASNTGIDASPDAGLVLIACEQGILFLITDQDDPAFNTINRTVNTNASASGVEILPDAGLAVAFTEDNYLVVIGIVPGVNYGKIVGRVNTRGSIGDIDISPDGQIIYVTHPLTNEVSVYHIEYTGAPNVDASVNVSVNLELINVIEVDEAPYAIAADPRGERVFVGHYTQDGQVTEIDVSGSIDAILFLEEMIESVIDAISERDINSKYGGKLLVDLEKTLSRYTSGQLQSAIAHLDNFIKRVEGWIDSGDISEDLGNAWLEAAYRIREQLIADLLEQESLLKGTSGNASDTRSSSDGLVNSNQDLGRDQTLKLQNQPNPFSHQTLINFEIPQNEMAEIPVVMRVFNTNGQVVRTLVHMDMEPGTYSVNWSGSLDDGGLVPDGIYLLELSIPGQREVLTISVIR